MWNLLDIQCPSEDMCKYDEKDSDLIVEMSGLATLLTSSAESLTQESPVWEEVKIFHNIQDKYKQILHCDKCLVFLQRVGGCLRKMVILNLSKSFLDLGELIISGLQKKGHQTTFPSKQQMEYALLRCQSAAKLVLEALHYSREAFYYLVQKLNVGHLVLHLVMAISVTARVNILFKSILANLFSVYRKLYPWLKKLKRGNHEWPQELNLPEDLEMWLKPDESQLLSPKHLSKERLDFLMNFFKKEIPTENDSDSVVELDSDEDCIIQFPEPNISGVANAENTSEFNDDQGMDAADDVGEVISRDIETEYKAETGPNLKLTPKQRMLVKKICSAKNLKRIRIIWNHLNVNNPDLLPKALTPSEIRIVERMLSRCKKEIIELKSLSIGKNLKLEKKRSIIKLAARKLIRHLGLSKSTAPSNNGEAPTSFESVRTFAELRKLYNTLYDALHSQLRYDKCEVLKKVFKSRKEEIKLLKERNERELIENLIFCTSKVLITLYEK